MVRVLNRTDIAISSNIIICIPFRNNNSFSGRYKYAGKGNGIRWNVGNTFNGRKKGKNPIKRLLLGAYSLYDTTSWLSDLLSYSRLLALGLATGVIAKVINTMAAMGGKSIGGVILFIVVFVFGHTFNLAINLLGSYVHTNRLQYVEFFGKFYEGGSREFKPFKENTKYINVKEN